MTDYVDPIDFRPAFVADLDLTAISDMILRCAHTRFPGASVGVQITGGCGESDAPLLARVMVRPKPTLHPGEILRARSADRARRHGDDDRAPMGDLPT